ncbi:MAG: sialate O-acetylesterase [Lentisphaeria bacterium]|jgi:sialate O-acetylesterase
MGMHIGHGLFPGHILQRMPHGARATVSGACTAAGEVTVTVTRKGGKALRGLTAAPAGHAAAGRFTATVAGLPPGGPYTVTFACGKERVTVPDVLVGDLWLMAGQSNMQGVGNQADAPKPHPRVRNFTMGRYWETACDPLHFLPESPDRAHGGTALAPAAAAAAKKREAKGVGVGVYFGKLMLARTGVPQGLIATAHGGTSMAQWDPALKDRGGDSLYGSMWLSLQAVGQPVAGVLWYQGCSETGPEPAAAYTRKMQELVAAVRRDLGQPKLPWITVQIGRVIQDREDVLSWNNIQEQQRRLPETIPFLETVPAVDLELDDLIHISAKAFPILAERLASQAARLVHRDRREKPALQVKSVRFVEAPPPVGPTLEVTFANAVGGLVATGRPHGFTLLDKQRQPRERIYKTALEGNRAILHLINTDIGGFSLMYGHGVNPVCNITDGRGMALPVFGPLPIRGAPVASAWFQRWNLTPIESGEDIAGLPCPAVGGPAAAGRMFADTSYPGLVNCHPDWEGRSGHVGFASHFDLPQEMELEVRTGYDGPFRLWIGGREVLTDLGGTNPALPDGKRVRLRLPQGRHPVAVLMALNGGRAWGFFLRLAVPGLDAAEVGPDQPLPRPWA